MEVCPESNARCSSAGECFIGCGAFGCEDGICDDASGVCKCSTDDECATNVCGGDSLCAECLTTEDCAGKQNGLVVCKGGECGCDSADTCPANFYDNAPPVCE
jgi:hypothetical protein